MGTFFSWVRELGNSMHTSTFNLIKSNELSMYVGYKLQLASRPHTYWKMYVGQLKK